MIFYVIEFCGRKADMDDFQAGESKPDPYQGGEGNVDNVDRWKI